MTSTVSDRLLDILVSLTHTPEVRANLDLRVYDYQLLDSIRTVELIVMIEREFGVRISPAEFERENWATPRKIIADVERRLFV
jgi:D-alanine--poly(phosphoribitol) ligase subunit 2